MFSTDKVFMAMPSRVIFGCGERAAMPGLLRKLGYRNALVVTDQFFSRDSGVIAELCAGLNGVEIGSVVFDGGQPTPASPCVPPRSLGRVRRRRRRHSTTSLRWVVAAILTWPRR